MKRLLITAVLALGAGCSINPRGLSTAPPIDTAGRLTIAYRHEVWSRDGAAWDTAIWIGQGFRDPVHVDLILPDGRVFTSTTEHGVQFVARDYAGEAGWWSFEPLAVTPAQATNATLWCEQTIRIREAGGYGYDWGGVARFVIPWSQQSTTGYFCSEAVVSAIQRAGYCRSATPWRTSPADLYRMRK